MATLPPIASVIRIEASSQPKIGGKVLSKSVLHSTRWIRLTSLTYKLAPASDDSAELRKWDAAERATRQPGASADGVAILAKLRLAEDSRNDPRLLLVRQFRPPADAVCVELPAGLIDEGETPEQAALRELREETGFTGTVVRTFPPQPLSPGLSNEAVTVVEVECNGAARVPQVLDDSESIEVLSVPVSRLGEALSHFTAQGDMIMNGVGCLALGMQLSVSA